MFSHEVNTGSSAEAEAGVGVTGRVFTPGTWYWPGIWTVQYLVKNATAALSAFKIFFQYNAMSPQDLSENYLLWEERRHKSDTLLEPFSPT